MNKPHQQQGNHGCRGSGVSSAYTMSEAITQTGRSDVVTADNVSQNTSTQMITAENNLLSQISGEVS